MPKRDDQPQESAYLARLSGCVKWWMSNHTNFPENRAAVEKLYNEHLARELASQFKEPKK